MANYFYLNSLGCDKNTVNSDYLSADLIKNGFFKTNDINKADLVIINTCAFIEPAKKESIEAIFSAYDQKKSESKLVITGCLYERYKEELSELLPEADFITDYSDLEGILSLFNKKDILKADRRYHSDHAYAYLKISEGCNNYCSFCVIPRFKGKNKSRKLEEILKEARQHEDDGIKELILVAQDLTQYGSDLKENITLSNLLKRLSKDFNFHWIRLLYLYPEGITKELIDTVKESENIIPYFDIPIQHTRDNILKRMGRRTDLKEIKEKFNSIRNRLPDSVIRSTVITGFPGESDTDHQKLMEDLKELKIDRLGVFKYSREEGTPAYNFKDQVSEEFKETRFNEILQTQAPILKDSLDRFKGSIQDCLIENKIDDKTYEGRLYSDSPEVDTTIYINSVNPLELDQIYKVKVNDRIGFEILGEIYEPTK